MADWTPPGHGGLESPRPVHGIFDAGTGHRHGFNGPARAVIDAPGTGRISCRAFPPKGPASAGPSPKPISLPCAPLVSEQPFTDFRRAVGHTVDWSEQHQRRPVGS